MCIAARASVAEREVAFLSGGNVGNPESKLRILGSERPICTENVHFSAENFEIEITFNANVHIRTEIHS